MAHKCFGIYVLKDNNEKFLTNLSQFNLLVRPHISSLMRATIAEINERAPDDSILDIDLGPMYKIYLVGVVHPNRLVLIFTTEPPYHYHLVTLARYLSTTEPKETITENFEMIKNEMQIKDIRNEMDATTTQMINNVDKLLERGEKLEDLLEKTKYLEEESKLFYRKAKYLNNWCCMIV